MHDLVDGLIALMESDYSEGPVNLGNPDEFSIIEFARQIIALVNPQCKIVHHAANEDDPRKRKPDIQLARRALNWHPTFDA